MLLTACDMTGRTEDMDSNTVKEMEQDITLTSNSEIGAYITDEADKHTTEEAAVLAAYRAIQQAMIDKDIEALDRLILDGTTFTHMSGKTQTKEEFFGEIADGTLNYYAYDIHDPQITVSGDEAVLTASVTLTAKVYGASGEWTLPVNARFTKIDGEWYSYN